jgi:enoyl-CoA hydratase/carnithine racemase
MCLKEAQTAPRKAIMRSKLQEVRVDRRTPEYWRITFDNPPFNIFGPQTIPQLSEIITRLEKDPQVNVVVFESAVPDFFLTHYDFVPPLSDTTDLAPGPTGLPPLPDMLVRLSRAPVASIASIRGRATGVGSELALASDMRFASREKAILSQWEVAAALVPGGGPMARLPRLITIADIKRLAGVSSLPSYAKIGAGWDGFISSVKRPQAQQDIKQLMEFGLQSDPDVEKRLPVYTGKLGELSK